MKWEHNVTITREGICLFIQENMIQNACRPIALGAFCTGVAWPDRRFAVVCCGINQLYSSSAKA